MHRKIPVLIFVIMLTFVIGFISLMKGCLSSHNSYGVVGRPAVSDDGKTITVLIAESDATSYQVNGGYRRTTYSTSYWLKQYETSTGKLLQKKKIVSDAEKSNLLAYCYGNYRGIIWLHTNGLKGYNLISLQEAVNEEQLTAANGFDRNNFPQEVRFIDAAVDSGLIRFTAQNGDKYSIDLATQKIGPYKETPEDKEALIQEMLRRYSNASDQSVTRCDTFLNRMYALAKDSIKAQDCRPGDYGANDVAYRMFLFKNDYRVERLGTHHIFDVTKVTRQGNTSYLNAFFASESVSGEVIHLAQPAGYLIIHQDMVGSNSKAIITRVDTSNSKIWESATGISTKIEHCIVNDKYCIITSNESYMLSPHIGKDALCIVDTETGKINRPLIKE